MWQYVRDYATPLAILIAGILIAVSIFVTNFFSTSFYRFECLSANGIVLVHDRETGTISAFGRNDFKRLRLENAALDF